VVSSSGYTTSLGTNNNNNMNIGTSSGGVGGMIQQVITGQIIKKKKVNGLKKNGESSVV